MTDERDIFTIDVGRLLSALWQKKLIIIISTVLCGAILFMYSTLFMEPQYKSSAMLFVNNINDNSSTVSTSELNAAKSLLEIYVVILESPDMLEAVIEDTGLNLTTSQLKRSISADSVNSTEIFEIKAETNSPETSKLIVDSLVKILPDRISEIVEGSSVKVVSEAKLATAKSSPDCTKYMLTGALVGFLIACAFFCLQEILDTTVHDEDYLNDKYDIPVLAVVPNMKNKNGRKYGYEKK